MTSHTYVRTHFDLMDLHIKMILKLAINIMLEGPRGLPYIVHGTPKTWRSSPSKI